MDVTSQSLPFPLPLHSDRLHTRQQGRCEVLYGQRGTLRGSMNGANVSQFLREVASFVASSMDEARFPEKVQKRWRSHQTRVTSPVHLVRSHFTQCHATHLATPKATTVSCVVGIFVPRHVPVCSGTLGRRYGCSPSPTAPETMGSFETDVVEPARKTDDQKSQN